MEVGLLPSATALLLALVSGDIAPAPTDGSVSRSSRTITLDGKLEEPVWQEALPITEFFEIYPGNLLRPKLQTQAHILIEARHLYISIRAFDPEPSAIRSHLTRRDLVGSDQDYVEILISSFADARSASLFRTNPHGVQTDGLFNEDTGVRELAPDLDFDVRTHRDSDGWTAEFRIPLSTLRYEPASDPHWRIVIFRNVPRGVSTTIASAPIARGSNCVMCFATPLRGTSTTERVSTLTVAPYGAYTHHDSEGQFRFGVDAKWHVRSDVVADFTIKPDFSHIEADALLTCRLSSDHR